MVRSGRLVSVVSLSVKFVVNVTGNIDNGTECIQKGFCEVACDLNITLPISLSLKVNKTSVVGLVHNLNLAEIEVKIV